MMQSRLFLIATTLLALVGSPSINRAADQQAGTLYWGNGDSLSGTLVSAKGDTLIWKSPLFADPLQIDLGVLSSVNFPEPGGSESDTEADSEFRITLANQNVLHGTIASIDGDTIQFNSRRHGKLRLGKADILNLQRSQNQGLLYFGPRGLDGWSPRGSNSKLTDWREENDGSLTTLKGESGLLRKMEFPDRCEVEVVLTSTSVPDFVLSLGSRENGNPRVEMWGDEMICRCGLDFVELKTVEQNQRKLHFHVFVDFKERLMAVYSSSGQLLGKTESKNWEAPTHGLILEAIEGDLTIKHLRISEWDGTLPKNLLPGETRVHTRNGDIHYGTIAGYSPDDETLQVELNKAIAKPDAEVTETEDTEADAEEATDTAPSEPLSLPIKDVTRIVLSTKDDVPSDAGKTLVSWKNGGFVSGTMVEMTNDFVSIDTGYSTDSIVSKLNGVRKIKLPNSVAAKDEPDRLFFEGGSLRGNLTVEDHDSAPIRWKPVGGKNATTLVSNGKARFQRGQEPENLAIDTKQFPDVVFLKDGDVFPCLLQECDAENVQITTPVAGVRQLHTSHIQAIELGSVARARQAGFSAPGWKRISGGSSSRNDELSFSSNGAYGNDSILTGNAVSFHLEWTPQTYGSLTTWLYADSLQSPEMGTPICMQFSPNQLTITDQPPNQNGRQIFFGGRVPQGDVEGVVRVTEQKADIRLITRDGKVHVSVNGKDTTSFELKSAAAGSRTLLFSSMITRVSNRVVINGRVQNGSGSGKPLSITDFQVRNIAGTSVAQFINAEARQRTLTIPRFQKDDPPTHVLLAPNGDLLRGRLLGVDEGVVRFESRLEAFRFPRDRVAAIVWLQKPVAEGEEPETPAAVAARPETAVQAQMDNGYTLTMTPERMADGQLIGSSSLLGECRIPAKSIRDLFLGRPDGREEIMSYVHWIPSKAREPEWDKPKDGDSEGETSALIGQTMDDFELETLDGEMFRLSDHQDKVVVLDFWASWCGPCIAALPQYIKATSEFDASEVIFVAVNLEESPERIHEFLDRQNLNPMVAMDRGSVIAKRFGVTGIPHSVVLGKGSVVKHVTVGYKDGVGTKTRDRIVKLLDGVDETTPDSAAPAN